MEVSLFSWPEHLAGEADFVAACVDNGLTTFHLRKPNWTYQQTYAFLSALSPQVLRTVVLHHHFELRHPFPVIKGIHFSSHHPVFAHQHLLREREWLFTTSVHQFDEIDRLPPELHIVFISPVFDSISKTNHSSNFQKSELQTFLNAKPRPPFYYALGGINLDNIAEVKVMRFDGLGILGAVWHIFSNKNRENALTYFKAIQQACQ